ncbi:uncharacterized protein [Anoplolepis gracilipes]|uniref:uncharacterized protein n=1 Tax=Anoplolepis gracilipes TaxID=354296 RepID=UPI003BA173E5
MADLRIRRLEDSITRAEIVAAISGEGKCGFSDVKVGAFVKAPRTGLNTLLVQCPIDAANKLIQMGKVPISWYRLPIELLPQLPFRCFKCMEEGHVQQQCGNDRSCANLCFRCGKEGHKANSCSEQRVHCALCADLGAPAGHRMGGMNCHPPKKLNRKKAKSIPPSKKPTPLAGGVKGGIDKENPSPFLMEVVVGEIPQANQTVPAESAPAPMDTSECRKRRADSVRKGNEEGAGGKELCSDSPKPQRKPRLCKTKRGNEKEDTSTPGAIENTIAERGIGLAIVSEPYRPPSKHPNWRVDGSGTVAVIRGSDNHNPPCSLLKSGRGYVAVKWGFIAVVACYAPLSWGLSQFELYLGELEHCIRSILPQEVVVAGDFNVRAQAWGDRLTTPKGEVLLDWMGAFGLCLLNTGNEPTCDRLLRGASIVDLTMITPSATRLNWSWGVVDQETLSDHRYIEFGCTTLQLGSSTGGAPSPRWNLKKLDPDRLTADVQAILWQHQPPEERVGSLVEDVARLVDSITQACDFSMPKSRPDSRRAAYWWTEEILLRRGQETPQTRLAPWARSWDELIASLDADPRGRPYKIVTNKLRHWAPPVTFPPGSLGQIVGTLFPTNPDPRGLDWGSANTGAAEAWSRDLEITEEELKDAVRGVKNNKTSGPDGIPERVWKLVLEEPNLSG